MHKLTVAGISLGALTVGLYTGVSIYTSKVAEAKINELIADVEDTVAVEYDNAKVSLLGQNLTVNNLRVASLEAPEEAVNIDKIIVREYDDKSDFPTVVDASVKGIHIKANQPQTAILAPVLSQAGYGDALAFDLDTRYTYNTASKEMTLEKFRLGADDFGYFEVTFQLGNFDPKATTNDALTLQAAEVIYRDQSFVENLLAAMAAQSNQDVEQFKRQLTSGISQNAQFLVATDSPSAKAVVEEAVAFIEEPTGFSITANPAQPLLVSDLAAANSPEVIMQMLNLEIKAN